MDPLSKYSKKICGNKRLIENLKYEIKCHENEGKLIWTKKLLTPPFNCSICSQVCSYHYYGDRCQGCRFNKCLLMGMDASLICVQNTEDLDKFIENLKEYQLEVIAQYYEQIAPNNDNQLDYDCLAGAPFEATWCAALGRESTHCPQGANSNPLAGGFGMLSG
uniref:Nuclear receptor domain-containing protein n=1 Tax=Meloidogyne floridensis TaxID=298350 RepID=A0A915ND99_9BILA